MDLRAQSRTLAQRQEHAPIRDPASEDLDMGLRRRRGGPFGRYFVRPDLAACSHFGIPTACRSEREWPLLSFRRFFSLADRASHTISKVAQIEVALERPIIFICHSLGGIIVKRVRGRFRSSITE